MVLTVEEKPETLELTLQKATAPDEWDGPVFPATPGVIDPTAEIRFASSAGAVKAVVPKSEYAPGPVNELTLVFSGPRPFSVSWKLAGEKTN